MLIENLFNINFTKQYVKFSNRKCGEKLKIVFLFLVNLSMQNTYGFPITIHIQ